MKEMFEEEDYFKYENIVIKFWLYLFKYVFFDLFFIFIEVFLGVVFWNIIGYF